MRFSILAGSLALVSIFVFGCITPKGNTVHDKRNYVLDMKNQVLSEPQRCKKYLNLTTC